MACRTNSTDNGRLGVHLRSYKTTPKMQEEYPGFKIWEAARATSAAPTYFERLKVGDDEFIDGGMGYNNPVLE
jgi:patatin-like phospholipase/acyl hydrolase